MIKILKGLIINREDLSIREQILEALEPHKEIIDNMVEGYVSVSIHNGEVDIITLHETKKVKK